MQSVKQGNIKYHFLSLWYDSICDWTQVSWAIGEHPNQQKNPKYYHALVKNWSSFTKIYSITYKTLINLRKLII